MSDFATNIGEAISALAKAIDAVDRATRTANGLEQLAAAPLIEMIEHCKIDAETLKRASEEAERRATALAEVDPKLTRTEMFLVLCSQGKGLMMTSNESEAAKYSLKYGRHYGRAWIEAH